MKTLDSTVENYIARRITELHDHKERLLSENRVEEANATLKTAQELENILLMQMQMALQTGKQKPTIPTKPRDPAAST